MRKSILQLQVSASLTLLFLLTLSCQTAKQSLTNNEHNVQTSVKMKNVLIIGMNPKTIDFSNPELPPTVTLEGIENGTKITLNKLEELGYKPELFLLDTGTSDVSNLSAHLQSNQYQGILIGNGIRGIKSNFLLFEKVINVVHQYGQNAKIIFNTNPIDNIESIQRWL